MTSELNNRNPESPPVTKEKQVKYYTYDELNALK